MNERIRELEARAKHRSQYLLSVLCNKTNRKSTEITEQEKQEIFSQTFAELIVQEATDIVYDLLDDNTGAEVVVRVKEHFGVE